MLSQECKKKEKKEKKIKNARQHHISATYILHLLKVKLGMKVYTRIHFGVNLSVKYPHVQVAQSATNF